MNGTMRRPSEGGPIVSPKAHSTALPNVPVQAMKTRSRRRALVLGCVLLLTVVSYTVLWPMAAMIIDARRPFVQGPVSENMTVAESVRLRSSEFLITFWFFAVGASLGSFLNVAAGRIPIGKSICGSSRCPQCDKRITRWDIVPILSWLVLGGQCRFCEKPISPRYPTVEALAGGMFLLLLFVELLSGCANVPFIRHYGYDGFVWILFYPKWDFVGMYIYHMTLLCLLLVVSLIEWDRARVPKRLILFGVFLGGLFAAIWPALHPVEWLTSNPNWVSMWSWLESIDTTVVGVVAGAFVGTMLSVLSPSTDRPAGIPTAETSSIVLVGTFLGWQATVSVTAITVVLELVAVIAAYRLPRISNMPKSGWVLSATLLHLCLWRVLTSWPMWPGPHSSASSLSTASASIVAICILTRVLSRSPQTGRDVNFHNGEGAHS